MLQYLKLYDILWFAFEAIRLMIFTWWNKIPMENGENSQTTKKLLQSYVINMKQKKLKEGNSWGIKEGHGFIYWRSIVFSLYFRLQN